MYFIVQTLHVHIIVSDTNSELYCGSHISKCIGCDQIYIRMPSDISYIFHPLSLSLSLLSVADSYLNQIVECYDQHAKQEKLKKNTFYAHDLNWKYIANSQKLIPLLRWNRNGQYSHTHAEFPNISTFSLKKYMHSAHYISIYI